MRPRMNLEDTPNSSVSAGGRDISSSSRPASVGRAERTEQTEPAKTAKPKKKKKKKLSRAALILRSVVAVLVLAVVIFLCVLGNYIYQAVFVDDTPKVPPISPTSYDVTPTADKDKVAYYLVGVLGETDSSNMSMVSVACFDKQKQTVNVMQIPTMTYVGKGDERIVNTVGAVWANPKPYDWCDTCRKRVYAPEINEGEVATHTVCGAEITKKTGSSVTSLVDIVNDQLSLPVDGYFILPQKGLQILIDSVGGVDIALAEDITLADLDYTAGTHTLSGAAATEYATYTDGTLSRDMTRMTRQREVFGALLTRMLRLEKEVLREDVIEEVMDSAGAIRTECSVDEMVDILTALSAAGTGKTTMYLMPGEATVDEDGNEVFSSHNGELLTLLGSAFNPYGQAISASDVTMPELSNTGAADQKQQMLSDCVVDQTGKLLEVPAE